MSPRGRLLNILLLGVVMTAPVAFGRTPSVCPGVMVTAVPEGQTEQPNGESGSEGASEPAESGQELLYKTINFIILVGALGFLLRKPVAAFFAARSEEIRKELDEGKKALQASEARLGAVEAKLRHLEEDIARFAQDAQREMATERERLRKLAASDAEKIVQAARLQIGIATRAAKLELKRSTANEAIRLAEGLIRGRIDEATRDQLFNRFLGDVEATRN